MFDTIETDGNCTKCRLVIPDWQTKQLYCLMDVYKLGDRIPLHPNTKHLMIYSGCNGKTEYTSNADGNVSSKILWDGCGTSNDAICILDKNYILQKIEVLQSDDERMIFTKWGIE